MAKRVYECKCTSVTVHSKISCLAKAATLSKCKKCFTRRRPRNFNLVQPSTIPPDIREIVKKQGFTRSYTPILRVSNAGNT